MPNNKIKEYFFILKLARPHIILVFLNKQNKSFEKKGCIFNLVSYQYIKSKILSVQLTYIFSKLIRSNTDIGSKIRVYCYRYTTTLYLAFIVRNLFYFKIINKV